MILLISIFPKITLTAYAFLSYPRINGMGLLEGDAHSVEIADDHSDLIEKLDYYASRPKLAEEIIENAHRYIAPFRNARLELVTQLLTAERYFQLTGQM